LCYLFVEANIQAAFALHLQTKKREKEVRGQANFTKDDCLKPNMRTFDVSKHFGKLLTGCDFAMPKDSMWMPKDLM